MTKDEKLSMGYNTDFFTKFLMRAPEPMTPDAPTKPRRAPRLIIGFAPWVLFVDDVSPVPSKKKTVTWKRDAELVSCCFIRSRRDMSDVEKAGVWYPLDFVDNAEEVEVEEGESFGIDDEDSIGTLSYLIEDTFDTNFIVSRNH